jgi:hypothetical protein
MKPMNESTLIDEKQTKLLIETIGKNGWCGTDLSIRVKAWSTFPESPDVLRNYLCKDGSGYIRGYYDGAGTFYVMRFHLRDEEWREVKSSSS